MTLGWRGKCTCLIYGGKIMNAQIYLNVKHGCENIHCLWVKVQGNTCSHSEI